MAKNRKLKKMNFATINRVWIIVGSSHIQIFSLKYLAKRMWFPCFGETLQSGKYWKLGFRCSFSVELRVEVAYDPGASNNKIWFSLHGPKTFLFPCTVKSKQYFITCFSFSFLLTQVFWDPSWKPWFVRTESDKEQRDFLDFLYIFYMYFIQHCSSPAQLPLCRRMLGSNPGLLRLRHWQSDALASPDHSAIDLIHCG